jgi:hypothetical protein
MKTNTWLMALSLGALVGVAQAEPVWCGPGGPEVEAIVTQVLPRSAAGGQLVPIDIDVTLPAGQPFGRLGLVEQLPAGWAVNRLEPYSAEPDNTSNRAVWRLNNPPSRLHLRVWAAAPYGCGGEQIFCGSWKLDGSPISPIGGDSELWLGAGQPPVTVAVAPCLPVAAPVLAEWQVGAAPLWVHDHAGWHPSGHVGQPAPHRVAAGRGSHSAPHRVAASQRSRVVVHRESAAAARVRGRAPARHQSRPQRARGARR